MNRGGICLFEQQNATCEHGGEHHTHRRARLNSAQPLHHFDEHHSGDGRSGCTQQHGNGGHSAGDQKRHHYARQHHMADRVTDQGLTA